MQKIYSPADSAEAYMLVHLLEQSNIKAFVQGELLSGAIGGIPSNDLLRLNVADEDAEQARALILAWEKQQPVSQEPLSEARSPLSLTTIFVATFSLALGWFANEYWPPSKQPPNNSPQKIDQNQDGKTDLIYQYLSSDSQFPSAAKYDNNFNGVFEYITEFDAKGIPYTGRGDIDEDGKYETIIRYTNGVLSQSETDTNNDSIADVFYDEIKRVRNVDDLKSGKLKLIEQYNALGLLVSAELDSDNDGVLDTRYTYDRFNQITATKKISAP
jgi:Putative prokaryotic signal transducing protein/RHS Repeat